jgi:serine/threonine protein kinase
MLYCINPDCTERENPDNRTQCQGCGTNLKINDDRYRLIKPLRKLGQPGYNTEVFEAINCGEHRVILKVLITDTGKLVELFERERETLEQLQHQSGIPRICGSFAFRGRSCDHFSELPCLVMEKIEGQNLEQWLDLHGSISQYTALNWLQQLTKILQLLHSKNFLHRDIKPSNIMIRPSGELVLIDFGTVREIERSSFEAPTRISSEPYTPEEQLDGEPLPQSDFFALGRTFAHLLTGEEFEQLNNDSPQAHLIWRDKVPKVSKPVTDFIDRLMAQSPKDRPQTAKEIIESIETLQTQLEGQTLEYFLKRNGLISQECAINWLEQLTKIIEIRYQQKIFTGDIRPANIILMPTDKPYGKLKLIDFELENISEKDCSKVSHLPEYAHPELEQDSTANFFALGRTLVHLLTNESPGKLETNPTGRLIWRNQVDWVSEQFANLIDALIEPSPQRRLHNPNVILNRLKYLKKS